MTRLWIGPSLVQVACNLFVTKPLPKLMRTYCELDPFESSVTFSSKLKEKVSWTKLHLKMSVKVATVLSRPKSVKSCVNAKNHIAFPFCNWTLSAKLKNVNYQLLLSDLPYSITNILWYTIGNMTVQGTCRYQCDNFHQYSMACDSFQHSMTSILHYHLLLNVNHLCHVDLSRHW